MTTTAAPKLRTDDLLAAARAKAGLDDFGDGWFVEPLDMLVRALDREARLSDLGLLLTQRRLTALLVDRLRLRAHQRAHPEVLEVEPQVAAVICGLPRTGSTLLHRLLSASPQLTSTLSWETSYPLPFPGEGPEAEERKRRARERMELFLEHAPDFADIHDIVWDGPEEDVILLDRTFVSMSFDSFYWVPSYGDWLRQADHGPAYDELRQWLQVLQRQQPGRADQRWVLKSPHHLLALDTVLDAFAGSRIVMTHRTPVKAVPSYASMVAAMSGQYADDVRPTEVGPYWSRRFATALAAFREVRGRRPDRFVDVRFLDSVQRPVETACEVGAALGLHVGDEDRAAFEAYVARDRAERAADHRYTPEEFGLSEDQLARDFAAYIEVYP
jgi:hypothetical protein